MNGGSCASQAGGPVGRGPAEARGVDLVVDGHAHADHGRQVPHRAARGGEVEVDQAHGHAVPEDSASEAAVLIDTLYADSVARDVWEPALDGARVERLTSYDRGIRSFDVGSASLFFVAVFIAMR